MINFRSQSVRTAAQLSMILLLCVSLPSSLPAQQNSAKSLAGIFEKAGSLIGTPYRSGGSSPEGFDCSGFVKYLYQDIVAGLPRLSRDMARTGRPVDNGEWKPGDLMFYATGSDPNRINHVAIWMGDNRLIHSISDGPETGVVVTPANARYWRQRFVGSRRVLDFDVSNPETAPELTGDAPAPESPWNDFDGILRGDYAAWKQQDEEAFEAYKRENG